MVGKGSMPTVSSTQSIITNDNTDLGVIVDRSIFDDDVELTIPTDLPMVIDEERSFSDSALDDGEGRARVMKNGKVRRKLRWKPPTFRRNNINKNASSSDQSVVSALTVRSTATNRSSSTARSFLSHFSRKSHSSFHTFHSTETPVVKNSRQSQHTFQRPNYNDTFDYEVIGPSTIATEGRQVHNKIVHSPSNQKNIIEGPINLVPASPQHSMSAISPMTQASLQFFDPFGESDCPVTTDLTEGVNPIPSTTSPPPPKQTRSRRPPLFKRRMMLGKQKLPANAQDGLKQPPSPTTVVQAESTLSTEGLGNDTPPTIASSSSPLSETISLERQESILPSLDNEDYEDDRRVTMSGVQMSQRQLSGLKIQRADSTKTNDSDPGAADAQSTTNQSLDQSIEAAPAAAASGANTSGTTTTPATRRSKISSRKVRVSVVSNSSPKNSDSTPPRRYNRPVDTTISRSNSRHSQDGSSVHESSPKTKRSSVPVDLDEGVFLQAENNLRAIHDMAAEHLAHGEYDEATEVFEEILRGQEARYGNQSYRVGTALHNLGLVHMKNQKYDKAIEVCKKAVAVRKAALAPNHPDVAVSLAQLGVAYLEKQNYDEALTSFQESLHIRRNQLGPRHPKCAKILNNLGCTFYALHRYSEAREVFEEALDIQRTSLRTVSEETQNKATSVSTGTLLSIASTLCNLGSVKSKQGKLEEAEYALEEALLIQQSVLPDDHPAILATLESMEFVSKCRGNSMTSPATLLSRWARRARSPGTPEGESSVMCTQHVLTDILNLDGMSVVAPHLWFEQFGDAIAETAGCGTIFQEQETNNDAPTEQPEAAQTLPSHNTE